MNEKLNRWKINKFAETQQGHDADDCNNLLSFWLRFDICMLNEKQWSGIMKRTRINENLQDFK